MQQHTPIFLALALILTGPADIARAESLRATRVTVTSAGLDLRTATGAEAMLKRLDLAAMRVCGGKPPALPLDNPGMAGFEACRAGALKRAVADLDSSLVAGLFENGGSTTRRLAGF